MSKLDVVHLVPVPSPNGTNHCQQYFRVNEGWSQEELMALDAAPNPQPYLTKTTAESGRKPQDFAPGGLRDEYAPPEGEDEDDEGEGEPSLLSQLEELDLSPELLTAIRRELSLGDPDAEDDKPENFPGQPLRGGKMLALKQAQDTVLRQGSPMMAYDEGQARARYKRLVKKNPKAAKKFFEQQAKSAKSFAERHPDVARIGRV